ncbi:hypothetical protein NLG97_g6642 [Lecanicillium saksenae]|uniref:Uncharacterized protein n=1 Tax=Lecanicillium saksenae TaxID=468837 RepID=A0ACC1QQ73_9HYPO|nr:hypothetical protein NLG97_g6642 [Lecanicillium saksenae]
MEGAFATPPAAVPRPARVFESSLHSTSRTTAVFDALIRDHLNQISGQFNSMGADSPPTPPAGPLLSDESATLLRELGDYFTRTAQMWSTMTHNLLQGPHIEQVALDVNQRSNAHTNLADFSAISAVDVEISRLRKIRDLTAKFSQDVQAVWRPEGGILDPSSSSQPLRNGPMPIPSLVSTASVHDAHFVGHVPPASDNANTLAGGINEKMDLGNEEESDSESDGDEELFASIDMDALKQRGKGSYTCPKGKRCDKGGVDKDGNVIVFDRNSSFAQHCNKHRKPWVCDLAHCPNTPKKRRFARRDGLERHKQTVKHEPKGAEPQAGVR